MNVLFRCHGRRAHGQRRAGAGQRSRQPPAAARGNLMCGPHQHRQRGARMVLARGRAWRRRVPRGPQRALVGVQLGRCVPAARVAHGEAAMRVTVEGARGGGGVKGRASRRARGARKRASGAGDAFSRRARHRAAGLRRGRSFAAQLGRGQRRLMLVAAQRVRGLGRRETLFALSDTRRTGEKQRREDGRKHRPLSRSQALYTPGRSPARASLIRRHGRAIPRLHSTLFVSRPCFMHRQIVRPANQRSVKKLSRIRRRPDGAW